MLNAINDNGTVFWVTGLPGVGKTTIGNQLFKKLKSEGYNIIFLDGDEIREILGRDYGYSYNDRKKLAMIYSRFCKMLSEQELNVICSTVSMFHECHNWNRNNIKNYKEIYIKAPDALLFKRQKDGLYKKAIDGKVKDVYGIDLKFEEPLNPDIIIENDEKKTIDQIVGEIIDIGLFKRELRL